MTNEQEGDGDHQREVQERPDEDNTLGSGLQTNAPVNLPQVQNNFQEAENLQTQAEQPETQI